MIKRKRRMVIAFSIMWGGIITTVISLIISQYMSGILICQIFPIACGIASGLGFYFGIRKTWNQK